MKFLCNGHARLGARLMVKPILLMCSISLLLTAGASAGSYYWDAGGGSGTGGTGTWDATSAFWRNGSLTGALVAWPNTAVNGDLAIFTNNTGGTVTLDASSTTINVNAMLFTNTGGIYVIAPPSSGAATLNFSGTSPTLFQAGTAATINAVISGSSGLTRRATTGTLILTGNNTFSGGLSNFTTTGAMIISNANALGSGTVAMEQNAGGTTAGLRLAGGIKVANAITIDSATGRENIDSVSGNNTLNGAITILGTTGNAIVLANNDPSTASTTFAISNSITTIGNFPNTISLRPNNSPTNFVQLAGTVNLYSGATLNHNGLGTLLITSTGNVWGNFNLNGNAGMTRCGAANCLYSGAQVSGVGIDTLDLNGFSQLIAGLSSVITNGIVITNSSATSDATLTINTTANTGTGGNAGTAFGFGGIIEDGVHKLNLVLTGGTETLSNLNTYSGSTTISGGTLALATNNSIKNSAYLSIAQGAVFDVSLIANYTNYNAAVTASGAGASVGSTAAAIKGGTSVNLGAEPIALNFTPNSSSGDLTDPALYISQGSLTLNGQISVTNLSGSPLGAGTYVLIQAAGAVSGSPTLNPIIAGNGLAAGTAARLAVSGNTVELVVFLTGQPFLLTIARHSGTGASSTYGNTLQFDVTASAAGVSGGTVTVMDGGIGGMALSSGSDQLSGGSPNTVTVTMTALNALTVGTHTNIVAVYSGDSSYGGTNSAALTPAQTVGLATLTLTGAAGGNKPYNGTTAATFSGTLNGVVSGDTAGVDVYLIGTGAFANAGPGTNIAITAAGTLGGDKAADYTLTQPTGLVGDIDSTAIWNTTAYGEDWSTASDWLDNAIGDGAGAIVDFSQAGITSDTLVYLDSPRTMGTLIFGDASTNSPASWILDNNGVAGNTLTLAGNTPGIKVNALGGSSTVTLGPVVAGTNGLTLSGAGWLVLATNNTWTGGTTIAGGTLQIGADLAQPCGTLGSGNVTNNGTLIFNRVGGLTITNYMTGAGAFVQTCTNTLGLVGTNTYSGGTIVAGSGGLVISNSYSIGSGPVNLKSTQTGANATLQISDGMNLTNSINIDSTTGREMIYATNGNNTLSGPLLITGASTGNTMVFQNNAPVNAGATLAFSNTITAPAFGGSVSLRGTAGNFGQLAGMVTAPNMPLNFNGNANWTISSTGNTWNYVTFSSGTANSGTLTCGAVNCLAANGRVNWASSSSNALDLAGCNQTIAGLDCPTLSSGAPVVTNSSVTSDAVLTITNTGSPGYTFAGAIKDGALHKISLTVAGGSQTLTATNTYSGGTTISAGTLTLGANALLNNLTPLAIGSGSTFDVSAIANFTNNGATLTASSLVGIPATINGGTSVALNPQSVTLNYTAAGINGDLADPALYVENATLTLNGQITVNNTGASPLGAGTYTLITTSSGILAGNLTLNPAIGGQGIQSNPNNFVALQTAYGAVNLIVAAFTGTGTGTITTIARNGFGASSTYGDALSFDVTVSPAPPDGETVAVKDGGAAGTLLGYGTTVGGACTITSALNALTAGSHPNIVAVYYGDAAYAGSVSTPLSTQSVAQKNLTLSGAAAVNKPYNGTTAATIAGTLNGVVSGDTAGVDVYLIGTGTFANAGPGTNITVTSTATLGGSKAANYSLNPLSLLAADIVTSAIWNTTASGGYWSVAANWVDNAIGDGAGATVDFSQLDITASPTVAHLDSARTLQTLLFGDANTTSAGGWLLDNNGSQANTLTLAGAGAGITVNALATGKAATLGAMVAGTSGLTKAGAGILILTNNNSYSGGTTVSAGTLQIGSGAASGTLGSGGLTNNGALVMDRSDSINVTNPISGAGSVSQSGSGNLTLSGANTYSGGTAVNALGALVVTNADALGTGPVNLQATQTGPGTTFEIGGGVNITNLITINSGTGREYILATNGNNTLSGSLVVTGAVATSATIVIANSDTNYAGSVLTVSGAINATNFNQTLSLRGNSGDFGLLSGVVTASNMTLNLNGNAAWTIASTGNAWSSFSFSAGAANNVGTLACGTANCLASAPVVWASGSSNVLDLAGFSQIIGGLNCAASTCIPVVTNSSPTSDALLTINAGTNAFTFVGTINDGATRKVALMVLGGTNTLAGTNTYSGNTTVNGGELALQQPTLATNSTVTVASGAVLQLGFAVTNQVAALVLNGVSQTNGVYNSSTAPAYLAGAGSLLVVSTGPGSFTNPTGITSFNLHGLNVVITATNGQAGDAYYLLSSTNLALPIGQWKVVATNVLGNAGTYTFTGTNVVSPGAAQQFYRLSNTNN